MTVLYEFPPTRSQRAKWVLEELGVAYTSHKVNLMAGEQNSAAYQAIHPLGVVPALQTPTYTMIESVAMVLQCIDEHPEKQLAPALGTAERAAYYQWNIFACSEMDPAIMLVFNNTLRPGATHDPELSAKGKRDFTLRAEALSHALEDREYLVGNRFSGADISLGHSCFMATLNDLMGDFPTLQAYFERLQQRPAYQRAYPDMQEVIQMFRGGGEGNQ